MTTRWLPVRALAFGLLLAAALASAQESSGDKKGKGKDRADPPGTTTYMNQLRLLFDTWDRNKDGYLDKSELAVVFRGSNARAYDHFYTKPKDRSEEKADERKDAEKDKASSDRPAKNDRSPDYSKIPDYQFLAQHDKDKDDRVSRDEFMEWAREYAMQLRDQANAIKETQKLRNELSKLKAKDKNRQSVESKLKKQQQQLTKLQQQLRKYEKIHASFNK